MRELDRLNEIVKTTNIVDFCIHSFDSVNLMITGSFDFYYYHEVELIFHEASYISLPTEFSYPVFRKATDSEVNEIKKLIAIGQRETVFCIEAETSQSLDKLAFFIVAETVSLKEGIVYYYKRENLKKGERIAAWVKKTS